MNSAKRSSTGFEIGRARIVYVYFTQNNEEVNTENKAHWETVYETKNPDQVSWTQEIPETSLRLIRSLSPDKTAAIIDVGGGDSRLVDFLLADGYVNITVLDISEKALEKAKARLGDNAQKVQWMVADCITFEPQTRYHIWHDRAAFHFLTQPAHISKYREIAAACVTGCMIIGTFSTRGPLKCSGLEIKQYDENLLSETLKPDFEKISCFTEDHTTPFHTTQNFLFGTFKRRKQ